MHRKVRQWVQGTVKPGRKLLDIAMESKTACPALEPGDNPKAGMGFPTGLSLSHQVAHYTPNPGQKDVVLLLQDVVKVDFGVQINGWIVDSALTLAFDPTYDILLAAVKEATNAGITVRTRRPPPPPLCARPILIFTMQELPGSTPASAT